MNALYYGDNLHILRRYIPDELGSAFLRIAISVLVRPEWHRLRASAATRTSRPWCARFPVEAGRRERD